jgi:hypothetical protein
MRRINKLMLFSRGKRSSTTYSSSSSINNNNNNNNNCNRSSSSIISNSSSNKNGSLALASHVSDHACCDKGVKSCASCRIRTALLNAEADIQRHIWSFNRIPIGKSNSSNNHDNYSVESEECHLNMYEDNLHTELSMIDSMWEHQDKNETLVALYKVQTSPAALSSALLYDCRPDLIHSSNSETGSKSSTVDTLPTTTATEPSFTVVLSHCESEQDGYESVEAHIVECSDRQPPNELEPCKLNRYTSTASMDLDMEILAHHISKENHSFMNKSMLYELLGV